MIEYVPSKEAIWGLYTELSFLQIYNFPLARIFQLKRLPLRVEKLDV